MSVPLLQTRHVLEYTASDEVPTANRRARAFLPTRGHRDGAPTQISALDLAQDSAQEISFPARTQSSSASSTQVGTLSMPPPAPWDMHHCVTEGPFPRIAQPSHPPGPSTPKS